MPDDIKEHLSISGKERWRKLSTERREEFRHKIKQSWLVRPRASKAVQEPKKRGRPVGTYHPSKEIEYLGITYRSIAEAARANGVSRQTMWNKLRKIDNK
jgi:hypothetical protein